MNLWATRAAVKSVWLVWFLITALRQFLPIAEQPAGPGTRYTLARTMGGLTAACEDAGWDGEWYRCGFFDDGTPLGSAMQQ